MQIHTLSIFPKTEELSIRISDTTGTPTLNIGDDIKGIIIYLMDGEPWDWDSQALYGLAEQLAVAGRTLAAKAGQIELDEQEAV